MELEIILPRDMTVQESHDLSLELQHKVGFAVGLMSCCGADGG